MFQAEGVITIGGTDYSDETIQFEITRTRELVKGPATFGNIRVKQGAGALDEVVVITALNEITAASLTTEFYDALDTPTSELTFSAKFTTGAIAADNPAYTGTFICTGATVGGTVNQHNQQTWTFGITAAGITKDITP
jgi:hypothetical protein